MGTLKSEGSLGTSAWQSMLCEWWDGNLVVFTLPREVAANRLQAATASMNLARVVKLLRRVRVSFDCCILCMPLTHQGELPET